MGNFRRSLIQMENRLMHRVLVIALSAPIAIGCGETTSGDDGVYLAEVLTDPPLASNDTNRQETDIGLLPTLGSFPNADMGVSNNQGNDTNTTERTEKPPCENLCEVDEMRCDEDVTRAVCEDVDGDGCLIGGLFRPTGDA